jgi:hypothetical protein
MIRDREIAAREQLARVHPDLTAGIAQAVVDAAVQADGAAMFDELIVAAQQDASTARLAAATTEDPADIDITLVANLIAVADAWRKVAAELAPPAPVPWDVVPVAPTLAQAAVGLDVRRPAYVNEMVAFENLGTFAGGGVRPPRNTDRDLEAETAWRTQTVAVDAWKISATSVSDAWGSAPSLGYLETVTSLLVQADELRRDIAVADALIEKADTERQTAGLTWSPYAST